MKENGGYPMFVCKVAIFSITIFEIDTKFSLNKDERDIIEMSQ